MSEGPPTRRHLGLDLGGTNIKWVVLEHDGDWRALDHGQVPTPAAHGPDAVVGRLATVGAEAIARCPDVSTIGIGVPGLYDPATGCTRFLVNIPGDWAGRAVAEPVAAALGCPVSLINDARAFGLAELRLGAGRGARSIVGLTLGTGVGGVIAIDGRVHLGHDGTAGEVGHQTIDPDGPPCGCGNHGCAGGVRPGGQDRRRVRDADRRGGGGRGPRRRRSSARRSRLGRALPRHRHRQHDHGHRARPSDHRRRGRGGRRAPPRSDP